MVRQVLHIYVKTLIRVSPSEDRKCVWEYQPLKIHMDDNKKTKVERQKLKLGIIFFYFQFMIRGAGNASLTCDLQDVKSLDFPDHVNCNSNSDVLDPVRDTCPKRFTTG